jgi:hypothetical protein
MKTALCILLLGFGALSAAAQDEDWGESKDLLHLNLEITQVRPEGKIAVRIGNVSEKPLRIWEEWNSWGAAHWRVIRIRQGQVDTFFEEVACGWTANWPEFLEIAAGEHTERVLDLNGTAPTCSPWRGLRGGKIRFVSGDKLIVVYDVPFRFPARDLGPVYARPPSLAKKMRGVSVWYGVAAAYATVQ